jgi:hypothetical protein
MDGFTRGYHHLISKEIQQGPKGQDCSWITEDNPNKGMLAAYGQIRIISHSMERSS